MDLSKLDHDELDRLKKDIDKELKRRLRDGIKEAQKKARLLAEKYGLSVQDLVGGVGGKTGTAGTVRFRHPDDAGKTWSGRGRKPGWIKEWEGAGKSLEVLRVE
jgi:DNA-binding protein H-NS